MAFTRQTGAIGGQFHGGCVRRFQSPSRTPSASATAAIATGRQVPVGTKLAAFVGSVLDLAERALRGLIAAHNEAAFLRDELKELRAISIV